MTTHRREDDKTIGEVYRRLVDMDERHEKKLFSIDEQVRLTNGRTTRLEERVDTLKRELQALKSAPPPAVSVVTPEGESISIKVTPKMWALIASIFSGLAIFAPMIGDWIKRMFQQ